MGPHFLKTLYRNTLGRFVALRQSVGMLSLPRETCGQSWLHVTGVPFLELSVKVQGRT